MTFNKIIQILFIVVVSIVLLVKSDSTPTSIKQNVTLIAGPRYNVGSIKTTIKTIVNGIRQYQLSFLNFRHYAWLLSDLSNKASSLSNINFLNSTTFLSGAGIVAVGLLFAFFYPQVFTQFSTMSSVAGLREGIEDIAGHVNYTLNVFDIDSEVCLKMAFCTVGKARQYRKQARSQQLTPGDIVDGILSSQMVGGLIAKQYRQAREFGASGGDCTSYDRNKKCPLNSETWNLLISSVNSTF